MCYLRNKEYKKRLDEGVRHLGEKITVKVEWTQQGRIARRRRPDVRRRSRVSQPRVRYNFERGGRSVYAPLKLRSSVEREKFNENAAEMRSEYRRGDAKTPLARRHPCCDNRSSTSERRQSAQSSLRYVRGTAAGAVC